MGDFISLINLLRMIVNWCFDHNDLNGTDTSPFKFVISEWDQPLNQPINLHVLDSSFLPVISCCLPYFGQILQHWQFIVKLYNPINCMSQTKYLTIYVFVWRRLLVFHYWTVATIQCLIMKRCWFILGIFYVHNTHMNALI